MTEAEACDHYNGQDELEPEEEPGLEPCDRCGKHDVLTVVPVQVSRQTMSEPAEYEELRLCNACIEGSDRDEDSYSGPWDVTSGDTAREDYEQAWAQKRSLR